MKKSKKKEGLSRLFEIAGQKKGLLVMAGVLSAGSAMCMLVPYWAVYEVLKELLTHGGNPAASDGAGMIRWGWIAFGGLVGGLVLLYAALMSSHVAAFRILYGLRVRLSEHIGRLPLGYLNSTSTGAIKKTMDQNIEKIEGFIAHAIPDLVNVVATVVVMLVIFFSLDVWLTVICLAVVAISLFLQFSNFMGKRARAFMAIYYDAQEKMSASAVQYVRGMPVVKIFGQSVRSFRQFNAEIQAYKTFALKCCDTYQNGMIAFTVLLNSLVTFILPMGILLLQANPQSLSLAVVWLFFIIMGPGMASPLQADLFRREYARHQRRRKPHRPHIGKETRAGSGAPTGAYILRCGVPPCIILLRKHGTGHADGSLARCQLHGTARRDNGACGPVGKRKVHSGQSDTPLLGCGTGRNTYWRREYPSDSYGKADGHGVFRIPGYFSFL